MRKGSYGLAIGLLAILFSLTTSVNAQVLALGKVKMIGKVSSKGPGELLFVGEKDSEAPLLPGSKITTWDGGKAVIDIPGRGSVLLGENSVLDVSEVGGKAVLKLEKGTLHCEVLRGGRIDILTKKAAIVAGTPTSRTAGRVMVDRLNNLTYCCDEGMLNVVPTGGVARRVPAGSCEQVALAAGTVEEPSPKEAGMVPLAEGGEAGVSSAWSSSAWIGAGILAAGGVAAAIAAGNSGGGGKHHASETSPTE
jgi:hypothetical protein